MSFEDKKENTSINLRTTGSYTFLSDGSLEPSRFMLHYYLVGLEDPDQANLICRVEDSKLMISGLMQDNDNIQKLSIYSVTGQVVLSRSNIEFPATINLPVLSSGIYILHIGTGKNTYIRKLYLN